MVQCCQVKNDTTQNGHLNNANGTNLHLPPDATLGRLIHPRQASSVGYSSRAAGASPRDAQRGDK